MKHKFRSLIVIGGLTASTALTPVSLMAQDASESGGLLVSFLEDTLSGDSRAH